MAAGSEIFVTDSLTIQNGTYISACDTLWRGIRTSTFASLSAFDSSIEGAEFAMRLAGYTSFECTNNMFIDNYIGISTGSPFETDQSEVLITQVGFLTGCKFYTEEGLPIPYTGQFYAPSWPTSPSQIPYDVGFAVVYLTGTAGLNFGKRNASAAERNRVYNMRNGIISRFSYIDVYKSTFRNFQGSIPNIKGIDPILDINQTGINLFESVTTIEYNLFGNLLKGVISNLSSQTIRFDTFDIATSPSTTMSRGIEVSSPSGFTAVGNRIKHGYLGISIVGTNEPFLIKNNQLTRNMAKRRNVGISIFNARLFEMDRGQILQNVITTEIGQSASIGIGLSGCIAVTVKDNDIYFPVSVYAGAQNAGISGLGLTACSIVYNDIVGATAYESTVGNSGIIVTTSAFNFIFCNEMDEMYRGMWLVGSNDVTNVSVNVFQQATIAFELWGPMTLGTQEHNGNEWYGDYTGGFGGFIAGLNPVQTAVNSKFYIDTADEASCVLIPCPIGPPGVDLNNWFVNETGVAKSCIALEDPDFPIADTLAALIRSELDFSDYNDELIWMRKVEVFDLLLTFPGMLANTVLDSFYDAEINSALGKLVWAQHQMTRRHGSVLSLKENAIAGVVEYAEQITVLDSMIDLNPVNKATLLALRVLKLDTLQTFLTDWLKQQDEEEVATLDMIEEAVDTAQLVTTTNDLEANLKDIIILSEPQYLGDTLTAMAASGVEYFATQCPWLGGRSLVLGQILFHMISDSTLSNTPYECIEIGNSGSDENARKEERNAASHTVVYPNPASDIIYVDLPSGFAEVRIDDALGGLKMIETSPGKRISLDVQSLSAGIYFVSVMQDNVISSHKVIILR